MKQNACRGTVSMGLGGISTGRFLESRLWLSLSWREREKEKGIKNFANITLFFFRMSNRPRQVALCIAS